MSANACSLFQSICASLLPRLCPLTKHDRAEINRAALILMAYPRLRRTGVAFLAISSLDVCWPANNTYTLLLPALDMILLQSCYPRPNRNIHSSSCTDHGHLCEKCRTEQATAKCAGNMKRRMIFGCASKSIKAFWSRFLLLSGFNSEGIL